MVSGCWRIATLFSAHFGRGCAITFGGGCGGVVKHLFCDICLALVVLVLLPEQEEQERDCHAEGGHGHHLRPAERGRGIGTGATKCKNESLKASRSGVARVTSSRTLNWPTPRS